MRDNQITVPNFNNTDKVEQLGQHYELQLELLKSLDNYFANHSEDPDIEIKNKRQYSEA